MTTTVRKEIEPLPDGNELVVEVIEDSPTANRVSITLMSKGPQGDIALGRANLGTVFRKQSRPQAESLVDAVLGYLRAEDAAAVPIEKQIEAKVTGKPMPAAVPPPVKGRPSTATQRGIELDHHSRKDFADTLRRLADEVETANPQTEIISLDIQPIRGGGQVVSFSARRK